MTYGTIKVDTVTFTNAGVDKSITLSGLVQNPVFSGNVTVTGTLSGVTVTGTTANFTSGNFTNISGGTHTITSGVFAAGSAASPSITFTGDLNTGIYSPGADQVAISTNSTGRLFVDSSGNVGINGPAPTSSNAGGYKEFLVKGGSTNRTGILRLQDGSGTDTVLLYANEVNGAEFRQELARPISFWTNGSEKLRITAAGLVGVGTSSPSGLLTLAWNSSAGINAGLIGQVNNSAGANNGYRIGLRTSSDATNWCSIDQAFDNLGGSAGTYIAFTTTSGYTPAERMRLTGTGLGVGTTSPGYILDVQDTANADRYVRFSNAGTSGGTLAVGAVFRTGGTDIGTVRATGSTWSYGTSAANQLQLIASGSGGVGIRATAAPIVFYNGNADSEFSSERLRIDSSGRVGIGTSSPSNLLNVEGSGTTAIAQVVNTSSFTGGTNFTNPHFTLRSGNDTTGNVTRLSLLVGTGGQTYIESLLEDGATVAASTVFRNRGADGVAERMRITSTGRVGIGTTTPQAHLDVRDNVGGSARLDIHSQGSGGQLTTLVAERSGPFRISTESTTAAIAFNTGSSGTTERARIDSSGRLLVGTSSARTTQHSIGGNNVYDVVANVQHERTGEAGGFSAVVNKDDASGPFLNLAKARGSSVGSNTIVASGDVLGTIGFFGADGSDITSWGGAIQCFVDGTPGANDMPGRLVFSTTKDGQSSPTEAMRINASQQVLIGGTTPDGSQEVMYVRAPAARTGIYIDQESAGGYTGIIIDRTLSDGDLISFLQAGTLEGTISVSGTTVSYNGAHLSRWSQLPLGAERTEILRGSVLSNIDEMCEWTDEENEQLNRMKVSDVEGDKNVSGVFQAWDDDETYTNDFYCAMTGDFIIRIGAGVTVERGDLLMSAGDGTAKPQDDDIIRSKTIAKVTSTNVSCTYDDGSYCVPCVLMAC